MSNLRPLVRLSPISTVLSRKNPKILLGGSHQPTLLRYLDGWPRRRGGSCAFLIQFADTTQSLSRYADDQFDLAVIQAPDAADAVQVIRDLTRIARQGLITLG
ncbi:class I SAM-dependent methyltransferase [Pseudomonas sp. NPDC089734]|uniref:class I SAM-dependent methyltransferase n=1 Tax=Pseudomonas sp. NPDC089734 TaxID=3364469 RepID=UPI0038159E80